MSDKWEIEREKPCYVFLRIHLFVVVHGGYPLRYAFSIVSNFSFFLAFLFFFLVFNKAATMITFDPIEEFIDFKKQKKRTF
jgi:hypothetical protein